VLLPVFGALVTTVSGLDATFATGILILSLSPGGALSNAICGLVRADAALSVSLTAFSSLITPFSIPFLYGWFTRLWDPAGPASLELPLVPTIARLATVAIVPIAVGMAIRRRHRRATVRLERPARVLSVMLFLAVVAVIVAQNLDAMQTGARSLGATMLALNLGATALGLLVAATFGLPRAAAVTLGIEVGMQNVATATFVSATLLGDATMALVPAIYAFIMVPTALGLGLAARLLGSDVSNGHNP
jgi:bile acid:Na+ symporter, BASS family